MRKLTLLFILSISVILSSCSEDKPDCPDLNTDPEANIEQFVGKWYEIASFPQFFNSGCECTTAEYTINDKGTVDVYNSCKTYGFIPTNIKGEAYPADASDFSKLFVKFPVSPKPGDYWILEFEEDYMLVGNPDRDNLYILSRTPQMDADTYKNLVNIAEEACFDISKLKITKQNCYND